MRFSARFLLILSLGAPVYAQPPAAKPAAGPVRALHDIPYVTNGHERQRLDLYLPAIADKTQRPVIVRIHGGAWRHGDKSSQRSVANYLKHGYIGVAINYRFSQHAVFPAQIEDCKAAIRWLRAHAEEYGIDSERIGVIGSSAGGHLAAMLGTTGDIKTFDVGENLEFSSAVCAVVDNFGPTDFIETSKVPRGIMSAVHQLLGGNIADKRDVATSASPITYASADDPPFLILHGEADPLVPTQQSELLYAALERAKVPATFHLVKGGGHGGAEFKTRFYRDAVNNFFEENVKRTAGAVSTNLNQKP